MIRSGHISKAFWWWNSTYSRYEGNG